MNSVQLNLPYPPSINHYYERSGKRLKISEKGKQFRNEVIYSCIEIGAPSFGDSLISLKIGMYPPDERKRDIDNILKPLLDALEKAGVYNNDKQVRQLIIQKLNCVPGGMVEVDVLSLEENNIFFDLLKMSQEKNRFRAFRSECCKCRGAAEITEGREKKCLACGHIQKI